MTEPQEPQEPIIIIRDVGQLFLPLNHYPGYMLITIVPIIFNKTVSITFKVSLYDQFMHQWRETGNDPGVFITNNFDNITEYINRNPILRHRELCLSEKWHEDSKKTLDRRIARLQEWLEGNDYFNLNSKKVYIMEQRYDTTDKGKGRPCIYEATKEDRELYSLPHQPLQPNKTPNFL